MCFDRIATKDVFGTPLCKKCWKKVRGKKATVITIDKNKQISFTESKEKLEEIVDTKHFSLPNLHLFAVRDGSIYWKGSRPSMVIAESNPLSCATFSYDNTKSKKKPKKKVNRKR